MSVCTISLVFLLWCEKWSGASKKGIEKHNIKAATSNDEIAAILMASIIELCSLMRRR